MRFLRLSRAQALALGLCLHFSWILDDSIFPSALQKPCKIQTQLNTETYRSGHNGADSKGSRAHHFALCESSRFLRLSRKCFIFLEFWMRAFQLRPCKSRAKFKLNLIRRDIEVVITGLTRNQFALTRTRVRIPLSPPLRAKNRWFLALFLLILPDFWFSFPTFKENAFFSLSVVYQFFARLCKATARLVKNTLFLGTDRYG